MAKITSAIVKKLNAELKSMDVGFEYYLFDEDTYSPSIRRRVKDDRGFVHSSIINCTDTFYKWLDKWFKDNYNIELCYNNTGEICWGRDYA
jgi:hypothetical protein